MSDLRENRFYPVLFMIILTVVLTAILAFSYEVSKERVAAYKELSFKQELLSLFQNKVKELSQYEISELNLEKINGLYTKYITKKQIPGEEARDYYQFTHNGVSIGKCYPVSFGGLWGTISLLVAVDNDFKEIIGLRITEQNETPGLGGRIVEDWFQEQFAGKVFQQDNEFTYWELIPEDSQPKDSAIRQVSGATVSSRAVRDGLLMQLKLIDKQMGD